MNRLRTPVLALLLVGLAVVVPPAAAAMSTSSSRIASQTSENVNYASKANWICRPDISKQRNPCLGDLDITSVSNTGALQVQHVRIAKHPKVDCFYLYPTIVPGFGNAQLSTERKEATRIA